MLDIVTLLVSGIIVSLLFSAAQGVAWTAHRDERSLLWWSAGNLANAGGLAFVLGFGSNPTPFSLIASNSLVLGAVALLIAGSREYNGKPIRVAALAAFVVVPVALLVLLYFWTDRQLDRVVVASLAIAAGALVIAREVKSEDAPVSTFARQLTSGFFVLCAGFFVGRACAAVVGIVSPSVSAKLIFDLAFLASFILLAVANFCLLFMVLDRVAQEDELTKLNSRRGLASRGGALVKRALAKQEPLSVVLFDLDEFKSINDTQGHHVGDQVIRDFAGLLRERLRGKALIGRFGGDEFCIILPDHDRAQAYAVAEDIRVRCAAAVGGNPRIAAPITVTVGIATLQPGMKTLDALLAAADAGLYQAKSAGRNRIGAVSDPAMTRVAGR